MKDPLWNLGDSIRSRGPWKHAKGGDMEYGEVISRKELGEI